MNDVIHRGDVSSPLRVMRENQRQNAHIHLAHDYGYEAIKLIQDHYDFRQILNGVLRQRAEMTLAGTLYDANDKLVGKIDLAKLGISPKHVTEIEALKAAEAPRVIGAHTAAAAERVERVGVAGIGSGF